MADPAKLIDILLVEDNMCDAELARYVFEDARLVNRLHVVGSGDQALDFIHHSGSGGDKPRPDIILLDLGLPEIDGAEVARRLRADPAHNDIPVILLTGSVLEKSDLAALGMPDNFYITKPLTFYALINAVQSLDEFWISLVTADPRSHAIKKHMS